MSKSLLIGQLCFYSVVPSPNTNQHEYKITDYVGHRHKASEDPSYVSKLELLFEILRKPERPTIDKPWFKLDISNFCTRQTFLYDKTDIEPWIYNTTIEYYFSKRCTSFLEFIDKSKFLIDSLSIGMSYDQYVIIGRYKVSRKYCPVVYKALYLPFRISPVGKPQEDKVLHRVYDLYEVICEYF